jgi:hypothetical protein
MEKTMSNSDLNNPENQKLVILATNTLARSGAKSAAALRDTTGRTYVAINVSTSTLNLDSLEAVLTVALASGISGIEAVVATGEKPVDTKVILEFAPSAALFYSDASGEVVAL